MSMTSSTPSPLPRRTLLAGAAALPLGAALAGCGGGSDTKDTTPQVDYEQGSATLEVELGPEIDGVPYPEGYVGPRARESEPFGDPGTTLSVITRSSPTFTPDTNLFSTFLEEKTGVKIEYSTVPHGDEGAPKVNAILAGGDLPDALMLGPEWMGGFTKSELFVYGQQGLFMPLDELIDRLAPELQEVFAQNPDFRAAWTAPDGAMYAFPAVNQCYHCKSSDFRTWIHTPSMEAAGFSEQPATLEEFEQMLAAMKEMNPDLRPMTGWKDNLPLQLIGAAHLDLGVSQLRRDGDAIVYTPTDPAMRDVFRVAARLVRDGLLDRNAFTQTSEQLIRLGMSEKGSLIGVCQGVSQGNFADVDYTDPEARYREFAPLRPFAGPDGDPVIAWNDQPGAGAVGLVIPADSADPETLVRWADFQLGLLSTLSMRLGVQDEHWRWAEEGDRGIDDGPALYKKIPQEKETQNTGWDEHGPFNLALDVRHGEAVDELTSFEPMLYRAGRLYEEFASAPESLFVSPFFDQDQAAQVGELRTNIDSAYVRGATSMCLGELDPDSDADWETYLSSLSNAGVDQYIEVLTEADAAQA